MKLKPVNCVAQEYVGPGREKYISSWKLISAIPGQESREGNEMIKKSLIAIALVAFLATTVQAASPYIKQDWNRIWIAWPYEYKALPICTVPVYMNIGNYVQIKDCHKLKLELIQIDCEGLPDDILKGDDPSKFFPCYHDCSTLEIRSNFEVKLGAKLTKIGPVLKDTKVYYDNPGDVVGPSADYIKTDLCMYAWKAEIWEATTPANDVHVADIEITVKPNA
jgi:hypothetical protein